MAQAVFENAIYQMMGYALQRQQPMSFFEIFQKIMTDQTEAYRNAIPLLIEAHKARLAQLYDLKKQRYENWQENILPYKIDDDDNIDIKGTESWYKALATKQADSNKNLSNSNSNFNDKLKGNFTEILNILYNFEDRKLIRERICRNLILFFKPAVFMITNSTYTIAAGPGTGKTYIANSLGKIFNKLLIFPKPSKTYRSTDFQGTVYGSSEMKVQKCFVENMDSFVVVDEAHNFAEKEGYWKAIVKTFVGNIQDGDKGLIGFAFVGYDSGGDNTIDTITRNDPGWKRRMQYRFTLPKFSAWTLYVMVRKNILDIYYGGIESNFPGPQKDALKKLVQYMYSHNLFPDQGGDAKSAAARVIEEIVAFPDVWLKDPNLLVSFVAKKYCEKVADDVKKCANNQQQIVSQFEKLKDWTPSNQELPPTLGQLYRDRGKKKAQAPAQAPAPAQGQKPKGQKRN
jgi:ATPase family associated with various cellular activities (AAA)